MATRKIILDQDNNEIFPITDTGAVKNPQAIGGTLESRLGTIEGKIPSTASSSNKLATSSDVSNKLNAPSQAGTNGQVLTSDGQGGQSWQDPQAGGVSDYDDLLNKPTINNYELSGNKTSTQLGLQDQLVSGTTIKTFNNQSILGSGNIDTVNGYINANSVSDLNTNYPAASEFSAKIALVPSTTTEGSLDYYTCVEGNNNTWSWVLAGTTSPIVSVQQVDVTQGLLTSNIYPRQCINGNGLTDLSSSTVYEYDVEGLDIIYVTGRSWTTTSESSFRKFIAYLDDNGALISVDTSMNYMFNNTPTILTNEAIQLPEGTKLIRLNLSSSYLTNPVPSCGGKVSVPQSLVKSTVTPNTIIYGTVTIDVDSPSSVSSNTEITRTTRQSAFGIMFPLTYSNTGRPTPVIAMLHGSSGCVTPAYLGYGSGFPNWPIWRQQYLDAGFAVMDINGYGVSTENDTFSQPNGNPQSVETLDKAWEYIKLKYNVCDKLLLHGTSMGGANAMSYLMNHPEKVEAVALFAPEVVQHVVKLGGLSDSFKNSVAQAWGYTDSADAISDGFSKLIGYSPFMEDDFDWVNMDSTDFSTLTAKTRLANIPIRIWHGTDDQNIPIISSQMLVSCLKRANVPVTLRTCNGGAHNISGGANEYVRNEAVSWFKRFVNN